MDCKIILPVGCNARCSFCFSKGAEFSEDFIGEVSKSLNKVSRVTANITGGEPTIYPKLIPLLMMLKNHQNVDKIILTTNGSNILEVRSIAEYINHLNISRHHFDDKINAELFGVNFNIDYPTITEFFNSYGVDVRCNCYLSDNFKTVKDLMLMVDWAVSNGFNSIKFRNDFNNGMKMNKWEKLFKKRFSPVYEDSCPVCRVSEYLYRIPVFFGYGVPEPSEISRFFEYVINQDGKLYRDYSCKIPVNSEDDTSEEDTFELYSPKHYFDCSMIPRGCR